MNWDQIAGVGKSDPVYTSEGGSTMLGQARIGDLWCRLMHTEPMWPSHGQYECRSCGRRFQVWWEQPSTATPGGLVRPPQTQSEVSLAAGR